MKETEIAGFISKNPVFRGIFRQRKGENNTFRPDNFLPDVLSSFSALNEKERNKQ